MISISYSITYTNTSNSITSISVILIVILGYIRVFFQCIKYAKREKQFVPFFSKKFALPENLKKRVTKTEGLRASILT